MTEATPPGVLAAGLAYPESPRWRDGRLWISDVHNFQLKAFDALGRLIEAVDVSERPAGSGFLPDGRLLLTTAVGRRLHFVAGGQLTLAADLGGSARSLLNDMVVDGRGRGYVGDTGFNPGAGEAYAPGQLLLFEEGRRVRPVADDLSFPNGMAISADGDTLFVAETAANRITAFDIEGDGRLSGRRLHAALPGRPDGVCLDAEGALWVGMLEAGFLRLEASGRIVGGIDVGPEQAIACDLGGEDGRTLFLCCATVQRGLDGRIARTGCVRTATVPVPARGF